MLGLRQYSGAIARRVNAAERLILRRWLRLNGPRGDGDTLSNHMYLTYTKQVLIESVNMFGGDSEALLKHAREYVVNQIMEGE